MAVVGVVGGGLAGLAAAHYAQASQGVGRVVVLESATRLGGWVHTLRTGEGVLLERGPRTVRPAGLQGANTLQLVEQLGLSDAVRPVRAGHLATSTRLVLVQGRLHRLPASLPALFTTQPPFSRPLAAALLTDLLAPRLPGQDCSLHEFITRRFGREVAEFAVDPLVRGICAGDSRQLSVHFIASYLHQLEQEAGRVSLGLARDWLRGWWNPALQPSPVEQCELVKLAREESWAMWSLENGLETLVETLHQSLVSRGVEVVTSSPVESIAVRGGRCTLMRAEAGDLECDKLVLALPAHRAARLLPSQPDLANLLASIPFVDVAVVNMEWRGAKHLTTPGFGFLVPSSQPEPLLGCIFDSCTFPQGDRTILTAMLGGAAYTKQLGDRTETEVGDLAVVEVSRILGLSGPPARVETNILPQCIAQYTVGHRARLAQARSIIQSHNLPLALAGSSYDGPGINDSILSSKTAVASLKPYG